MQPSSGSGPSNGQYQPMPTSIFPIDGTRPAGVHQNIPLQQPQQQQPGIVRHGLTQAEIERHQRPAHITGKEAEGKDYQAGWFPIPGNRWSWNVVPEDKDGGSRNASSSGSGNGNGSGNGMGHNQAESSLMANSNRNTNNPNQPQPQTQGYYTSNQSGHNQSERDPQAGGGGVGSDSISAFLSEMPTQREDPTRHVLWTELIRLKTRTLELQIAEARKKEKEAELEIMKLKAGAAAKADNNNNHDVQPGSNLHINNTGNAGFTTGGAGGGGVQNLAGPSNNNDSNTGQFPMMQHNSQPSTSTSANTHLDQNQYSNLFTNIGSTQPPAMSPFDLEAMLSSENMDNFLSWLPDLGDHPLPDVLPLAPTTEYSNGNSQSQSQFTVDPAQTIIPHSNSRTNIPLPPAVAEPTPALQSSPRRRSASAEDSSPRPLQPPTKKARRGTEKKLVVEQISTCTKCSKSIGRILIRSPKSSMPDPIKVELRCTECIPIEQPDSTTNNNYGSSFGTSIGTVETRKRMRVQLEIDDEESKIINRRQWCDVCQRIVGSGQILGGNEKDKQQESISGLAEIVCMDCDGKYQRCTDCGGGGGPRVGIGKWRMKQVFHPGRKTCSLNHTRLGDRTREIGVHVTPTAFSSDQIKEVLTRCKALWNEKTLARLAVPEMLEVDLPPGLSNPLRDFGDVNDMVTRNWPSREAMIKADDLDPNRFRRLLSLIWSHIKPRRNVRTVDLEEEWSRPEDNDDDLSTVLANVKRTNVVIPPGSELIGMWGGEWNLQNGSLLISTFIPFEGADGEDSTALSVGEMITKVQSLQQEINSERTLQAKLEGKQPELLPPCEHLWTVSGGYIPLVRERFADILIRKRSFVHVEEYLTRHPEFIESIRARPVGLHPDIHRPLPISTPQEGKGSEEQEQEQAKPLILVRWLGKEFDAAKLLEIKQMEFGGGSKRKKRKV